MRKIPKKEYGSQDTHMNYECERQRLIGELEAVRSVRKNIHANAMIFCNASSRSNDHRKAIESELAAVREGNKKRSYGQISGASGNHQQRTLIDQVK